MLAAANRGQSPCSVPADDADDGAPAAAASVSAPPHIVPAALCAALSLSLFAPFLVYDHFWSFASSTNQFSFAFCPLFGVASLFAAPAALVIVVVVCLPRFGLVSSW